MHYYDPMFYICSKEMPFSIRLEYTLKYEIDGKLLDYAVNTAIKRYPYFSIRVEERDGDIVTVFNPLPIKVFMGDTPYPLGSEEVNYHMLYMTYRENRLNFHITHVITDGAGLMPFMKTVLYYYICRFLNVSLPDRCIRTLKDPMLEGERENPFPEEKMDRAEPFYQIPQKEYFRIENGGYVNDDIRTYYSFRVKESDVMKFSHENDASPCAFFSATMAKTVWSVHPDENKDLVSAISFNLRSGLGNVNNYRLLCGAIKVRYPKKLNDSSISRICTCTRGAVMAQSQPENVHYFAKQKREQLKEILSLPDIKAKRETLSKIALADSVDNTFSVSYVGRVDYGAMEDEIEMVRAFTDGSVNKTLFIEISSCKDYFHITLLQGFSNDIYYRALLKELEMCGIEYKEEESGPLGTADIVLP